MTIEHNRAHGILSLPRTARRSQPRPRACATAIG
jgi:hypothetical protein